MISAQNCPGGAARCQAPSIVALLSLGRPRSIRTRDIADHDADAPFAVAGLPEGSPAAGEGAGAGGGR